MTSITYLHRHKEEDLVCSTPETHSRDTNISVVKKSLLHLTHLLKLLLRVLLGFFRELGVVERNLLSRSTRFHHQRSRSLRTQIVWKFGVRVAGIFAFLSPVKAVVGIGVLLEYVL